MTRTEFETWMDSPPRRPLLMGVVNVTPDSFSDGGAHASTDSAADHALRLIDEGADLIDIGGESTRPGSARTPAAEQLRRIGPVLDRLAGRTSVVISVDTTRGEVAQAALDRGAVVINDISAGRDDPVMLSLAARRGAVLALMHMRGEPATMQDAPVYVDVVREIRGFLEERIELACEAGVARNRIIVDPGIGFGKTLEHNLEILRRLGELTTLGCPLLVGTSRKGFIGRLTGECNPAERLMGTAASVAWSIAAGADMVRVHDVGAMTKVARVVEAIRRAPAG